MMGEPTVTLDALKGQALEEFLQRIADQQSPITVRLPDGQEISIQPKGGLKPLPALEGYVPQGWKEALYARD